MPLQRTVYRVLLSSTEDLASDRELVARTIDRVNREWAHRAGLHFECVDWRLDAAAGSADGSQGVIDADLDLNSIDLFIGLLWHRLGSPTHKHASGTVHEFREASTLATSSGRDFEASFFLKSAPVDPSKIDPEQLAKLRSFVDELKPTHLLKEYRDSDHLSQEVSLALSKFFDRQGRRSVNRPLVEVLSVPAVAAPATGHIESLEEIGILDCVVRVTEMLTALTDGIAEAGVAMNGFNAQAQQWSLRMTSAGRPTSPLQAKEAIQRVGEISDEMDSLSTKLESVLARVRPVGHEVFRLWGQIYALAGQFPDAEENEQAIKHGLAEFSSVLPGTRDAFETLSSNVSALPPITDRFVLAKKRLLVVSDAFQNWLVELVSLSESIGDR